MASSLEELFTEAFRSFLTQDYENISNGASERNLCGCLGKRLEVSAHAAMLNDYFADVEYNRMQAGQLKIIRNGVEIPISITCDLILHSRGKFIGEKDNLIAIEMKKHTRSKGEKCKDRNRLIALTSSPYDQVYSYDGRAHPETVCGYRLGVYIELNAPKRVASIEKYEKGRLSRKWKIDF